MNGSITRQEALFSQALSLPLEERTLYLERECADDPALRRQIEELLAAAIVAGSIRGRGS